ncbi:AraD1 family protein [Flagellimonas iocasae]|uniref:AraD1 family protein n=1 Tax=Flagellimonas iocasae TaxID=2055905 RepID=A0ABW4XUL5_9FLAO
MTSNKLHLVQLQHPTNGRAIAMVKEPNLVLIDGFTSVYDLALTAIENEDSIQSIVQSKLSNDTLDYDSIYKGNSDWKLLPSFDHPEDPLKCMVSGTGLTHHNSALNRQMMHQSEKTTPTDSIKIYEWGVQGGFPKKGEIGVQPEWFYKGNGTVLKGQGGSLEIPTYADDGGEEPELAGIYVVDKSGRPWRIGLSVANEFSDHIMEKKNYLYLAPSKIRQCAIGPEIVIDADFTEYTGEVSITRNGKELWKSAIKTGGTNMCHSLENLEYHHFKYPSHRIPFQAHVHFFGADAFSFGSQITLEQDDTMTVAWDGLGRPLQTKLNQVTDEEKMISVQSLK